MLFLLQDQKGETEPLKESFKKEVSLAMRDQINPELVKINSNIMSVVRKKEEAPDLASFKKYHYHEKQLQKAFQKRKEELYPDTY